MKIQKKKDEFDTVGREGLLACLVIAFCSSFIGIEVPLQMTLL